MRKILQACLFASLPAISLADYQSGGETIPETDIEEALRLKIACLADTGGDTNFCEIPSNNNVEYDSIRNSTTFTGSVYNFTTDQAATADRITISYMGYYPQYSSNAGFQHFQNCELVKEAIERQVDTTGFPIGTSSTDSGIPFGNYVNYSCSGATDLDISASSVIGNKHTSTGTEEITQTESLNCYGVHTYSIGVSTTTYTCSNGETYVASGSVPLFMRDMWLIPNELYNCGDIVNNRRTCDHDYNEDWTFKYERYYQVTATPTYIDSQRTLIDYSVDISYIQNKWRTIPVSEYTTLAPVDVSGITVFIPVPPDFPNQGYSASQLVGGSVNAAARNSTEMWVGCSQDKLSLNMTDTNGSKVLGRAEIGQLFGTTGSKCNSLSAGFTSLNATELAWEIYSSSPPDEEAVWNYYASLLVDEITSELVSQEHIDNLLLVGGQVDNDAKQVARTVSNYLFGTGTKGIRGFLSEFGSDWGVDNVNTEIARLTTSSSSNYGQGVLYFPNNETPNYWNTFISSQYASSVNFLNNWTLLIMSKDVIDAYLAGNDTTTLAEQMAIVAEDAQTKRNILIDKTTQFFDSYLDQRTNIQHALCDTLNILRAEIGRSAESCGQ